MLFRSRTGHTPECDSLVLGRSNFRGRIECSAGADCLLAGMLRVVGVSGVPRGMGMGGGVMGGSQFLFPRGRAALAGVIIATLVNHGLSVWFGEWLSTHIPSDWLKWILGIGFIALGLWMLIPDKDEEVRGEGRFGPFLTALVLFFIAEIGDKTQLATVALAVRFQDFWAVLLGTTTGMIAANLPVIWVAHRLASARFEIWAHRVSAVLFIAFGIWALV